MRFFSDRRYQETKYPYHIRIVTLTDEYVKYGDKLVKKALDLIKFHKSNPKAYTGYPAEETILELPNYLK